MDSRLKEGVLMISVIFCSRAKDNPDSKLRRLLDSAVACTTPREREQLEFLIKFDDDDDCRPPAGFEAAYPFRIKTFVWSRGEGRHALHHAQEYMFAQHDPRSRFCLMTADDFHFTRRGWVADILKIQDEFCIIGVNRPNIEVYAGIYEEEAVTRKWVVAFGNLSPVVSVPLIEVCQNFGWQSNVDSWLMGLSVVLYDMYGVVIWRDMPAFYRRSGGYGLGDTPTYNNMELTSMKGPANKYWFHLLRRQARNLYLNMRCGSTLTRLPPRSPWRTWNKLRAQPWRRLPLRLGRRLLRTVRGLLS
ncbi:MAG: hypothetical protein HY040_06665 [Planctomycetes bacterium]|nr:hypothetical protein [Planctomycetota bacterium]